MGNDVLEDEKTKPARDATGRWLPGRSANPAGRGMTNRQRISEKLLADLAVVWEQHGQSVLQRLAISEPGKLAQIAYGLLPRDVFISVDQRLPQGLDPEQWEAVRRLAATMKEIAPGATPDEIEEVLRSGFAKPVE
jgi:hypothetical protein